MTDQMQALRIRRLMIELNTAVKQAEAQGLTVRSVVEKNLVYMTVVRETKLL